MEQSSGCIQNTVQAGDSDNSNDDDIDASDKNEIDAYKILYNLLRELLFVKLHEMLALLRSTHLNIGHEDVDVCNGSVDCANA